MDRDARALAGGVETFQRRAPPDVGINAAHVVVRARPDRDRLVDRVDPGEDHRELAGPVEALEDLLRAQVPKVQQDVPINAAALVDLRLLRARDDVARGQLHRVRRVALEEAFALRVDQVGAFTARALGDQHARRRQRSRVELHHLHILERDPGAQRHRHPVAGARIRVGRTRVEPAGTAGGDDDGLRADRGEAAVEQVPGDHALAAVVVDRELPDEELLVDLQLALQHLLVEDVDEHVTGDVRRVGRARLAGRAEGALRDPAVLGAREDRSPVLELVDVVGRLVAEDLDRVLVAEVVRAFDGVEGVLFGIVLRRVAERRVDAALGGSRVAPDGMDLRDQRDIGACVVRLDGRAHARAAGSDDQHIVLGLHVSETTRCTPHQERASCR